MIALSFKMLKPFLIKVVACKKWKTFKGFKLWFYFKNNIDLNFKLGG